MGQLALLPRPGSQEKEEPRAQRVWIVSVDSDLQPESNMPRTLIRVDHTLALRYLPAWEVAAAKIQADVPVHGEEPTADGLRVVALTLADELIEQDPDGWLWIDGERLGDGPLLSYSAVEPDREQQLCFGRRVAWLFGSRTAHTFVFTVRVSEPLLWVFDHPQPLASPPAFDGWINASHPLVARAAGRTTTEADGGGPEGAAR